jgi:excisionase family DNA binding protein
MARPIEPAMTVREVAKFLNVGNITVYRLVQAGELPGFKVAGSWRFQRVDLDRWIEGRKRQAVFGKGMGERGVKARLGRKAVPGRKVAK